MRVLHPSPCVLSAPPETAIPSLQPAKEEWGWVGFQLRPGKGLMTRVWTNGSQWSYLLIQPQYFRSIKYVCLDRSLPPSSSSSSSCPPDMETWWAASIYLRQRSEHWESVRNDPTEKLDRKREDKRVVMIRHPHKLVTTSKSPHQIIWFQHWRMPYYLITALVVLIVRQPNSE